MNNVYKMCDTEHLLLAHSQSIFLKLEERMDNQQRKTYQQSSLITHNTKMPGQNNSILNQDRRSYYQLALTRTIPQKSSSARRTFLEPRTHTFYDKAQRLPASFSKFPKSSSAKKSARDPRTY
ncbi:hypothetical protein, partial [Erythrobacter sp. YJ-T3-07]|uniref:hypothetical protein n=1 Tax=Erythrobacter sp. YJ-T3-07 TaxID=2793063 RepID=UPI001F1AC0D9